MMPKYWDFPGGSDEEKPKAIIDNIWAADAGGINSPGSYPGVVLPERMGV